MQVEQGDVIQYPYSINKEDRQLSRTLFQFLKTSNSMDELFLTKLNELLEAKNIIQPKEISELSIVLSLAIMGKEEKDFSGMAVRYECFLNVQQLQKMILQSKRPSKQKVQRIQLVGWISKIWDKILHFSCYKNHLDLIILYYFLGDFLLYPELEFKRLLNLLLQSACKIKQFEAKTLEIILYLLMFFSNTPDLKAYSLETRTRLKMITILYLTKLQDPTTSELNFLREKLEEISTQYLHILMEQLQKVEESGGFYEEEIIWNKLFTALLSCYSRYDTLKDIILKIIIEMISHKLDLQTMKLLIRQLEITNEEHPLKKWREIYQIMNIAFQIYDSPKECLSFLTSKSFIKYPLQNSTSHFIEVEIKTSMKDMNDEKMLFMLQNKQRTMQIWFVIRHYSDKEAMLMMLKVEKEIITEKSKLEVQWSQFTPNCITIQVDNAEIVLAFGSSTTKMEISKGCSFNNFVIGDEDGKFGTSIKLLYSLSICSNEKRDGGVCYRMEINKNISKAIRKKILPSFIQIVKMVGDLDIFLMIISHAIKKLKRNEDIVEMIRETITFLSKFVKVKQFKHAKVTDIERERRLNAILCLCWQCSHETYNALAVLELLRFLNIRGVTNLDDELEVLCNFVFWKQFEWEYQKLMIYKIKSLFCQIRVRDNNHKFIKKYCQIILEETALYYRQEEYVTNGIEDKDNILRIHNEFITLVKEQLFYLADAKKNLEDYLDFIQFIVKMLNWTLTRRSNIFEAFDMTFSVQLSFLARELAEKLKEWPGKQQKLLRIVKGVIQVVEIYEAEEPFYEDKKIKCYSENRGFMSFDDNVIKQNLYFLAYSLISLKTNLLHSVIQSDDKGFNEINCIVWSKKVIQPLILSIDKSNQFILSTNQVSQIKYLFERLSLKSLSYDKNNLLLSIYLNNQKLFNEIDYRLSLHFCKIINIKDLLDNCFYSLKKYPMSEIQPTNESNSSKINDSFQSSVCRQDLKCQKIITLLGCCQDLSYQQGFMILEELIFNNSSKQLKVNHMVQHFILKGIVQKTFQILQNLLPSSNFISSLSTVESQIKSVSQISVKQQLILNRMAMIGCLQYFLKLITINDLNSFLGILNSEQSQCHLDNYRINIECVMNILSSIDTNQIFKLKNYYYFLQKQLLPLSKYYIQIYNIKPILQNKYSSQRVRKGSKEQLQLPKYDFKQESKNMYILFLDERNLSLLKVEKVWLEVQQRNKSFWSTFIGKQFHYTLYEGTGSLNEKYLLKKDSKKPKLQLPKMAIKGSVQRSASMMSSTFQFNNDQSNSSIFDDAHLYRKQPTTCLPISSFQQLSKQSYKNNKFKVLLITSSKIYQGTTVISNGKISFKENEEINADLYKKIFAAECEQRHQDQCIKDNYYIQEEITSKCVAIVKRYLFHDIAVEIHMKNRSLLMIFNRKDSRQAYLFLLEKHMKVLSREKLGEEAKVYSEKWENGFISNYNYLMKLNDLTGRSFNDLSQYYVFPWTITNFEDPINAAFLTNKLNFRDLSQPVGKLDKSKWEDIKKKYELKKEMQSSEMSIPNFLYGSFYSNPAIVCNFLIRISPFSAQHYELQSLQFDAADRLFYSITDSYKSLTHCSADFRELIPEFYYFPQFLKNRCAYNLGLRQNKDVVHNVALPRWAGDEYEFVFRMRKALECEVVSSGLHSWVDLVFGVYANKKYAIKGDNLFLADLYEEGYKKYLCEKDKTAIQLFKEFGQVPVPIINSSQNHPPSKFRGNFMDSILHPTMRVQQFSPHKSSQVGKVLQIYFYKRFTFLLFERQIRMYQEQKFGERDFVSIGGDFEGGNLKIWQMRDGKDKKHYCLILHKRKTYQVIGYQITKNIFNNYSIEGGELFPFQHKCSYICIYQNYIFCAEDKNIYIYKNIEEEFDEEYSSKNFSLICNINKSKYLLNVFNHFTHHRSRILFLKANQRGIVVSIDEENKCFITEISSGKVHIFNYFQIRSTYFEEKIVQALLHNMGFVILRTDYDRLLVYSFMGDNIVTKHLNFIKNQNLSTEKPLNMAIWNQELSEIVVGTNLGNLWKLDIFQLRKNDIIKDSGDMWTQKLYLNKSGFRKQGLLKLAVNRIGRHSSTLVYAQNNKIYILKSQKWQQAKSVEVLGKKIANLW